MSVKHLLFANSIFYRPRHEKYHNYVITVSILLNLLQLCYRRIVTFLINIVNCFLGRAVAQIDRRPSFITVHWTPKILFPIKKSEVQVKQEQENSRNRKNLLNAARQGDPGAIETLT